MMKAVKESRHRDQHEGKTRVRLSRSEMSVTDRLCMRICTQRTSTNDTPGMVGRQQVPVPDRWVLVLVHIRLRVLLEISDG